MKKRWWLTWMILAVAWGGTAVAAEESPTPAAAPPARYAVLSLISDVLSIVTYTGQTTSQFPTKTEPLALPDPLFDQVALLAAHESLKAGESPITPTLLAPTAALYAAQGDFWEGDRFRAPPELTALLQSRQITHLILLTRFRDLAHLQLREAQTGSGRLEGLGFYIDRNLKLRRSDTRESGRGFLAPFAYFKVSLVELGTASLLAEMRVTASVTVSAARADDSLNPWDALSTPEKFNTLQRMVQREVRMAVSELLRPRTP